MRTHYYAVRTGTHSSAAAALFALWMTAPEAESIWQPRVMAFHPYGTSALDEAERAAIKASHATILGFFDNDKTIALLRWEQTPEGARYLGAMMKAIQGE